MLRTSLRMVEGVLRQRSTTTVSYVGANERILLLAHLCVFVCTRARACASGWVGAGVRGSAGGWA